MLLSIREAALITGTSQRTLRGQLARGELAGRKQAGRWMIEKHSLPLTDSQRATVQARAEEVREAVNEALPSRNGRHAQDRRRSVLDMDAYRAGGSVLAELAALQIAVPSSSDLGRTTTAVETALLRLAEATYAYAAEDKITALRGARAEVSRAVGWLFMRPPADFASKFHAMAIRLETEVLGPIGGLIKWAEGLRQGRNRP